ncbi:wax ester/triacylglycerol synthase family O-acyltransferase [Nocardia sp. KC 131]|uniref:wax ester/triacylglycerol synthase family O-acyltransferase n=1 Tax=Nocardia arseniciresistens TaxID=3392119 RepID=UPI00398F2C13
MTELHPLDSGFIELEDSDRHISLGIGAVAIISGAAPKRAEFTEAITERLAHNTRLRQRIHRAPFDLIAPVWEDDPNFDVARHIRWTALPEPGDEKTLFELIATELAERLDRDHPLWQCTVVEHLADDRWALIVRAHHSLVDGVSGISLFEGFCDPPAGETLARPPTRDHEPSSATGLFELAVKTLRMPIDAPRFVVGTLRSLAPIAMAAIGPAAESSLNGPIGQQRRYVAVRTSFAEVRDIGEAFGVTVNDTVLAAVASAYRALLSDRGEALTGDKLRILVPVSMRPTDAKYVLDNRVSVLLPHLPIDIADPVERLGTIHDRMTEHKAKGGAQAENSILAVAARLPFAPIAWTVRLAAHFPQRGVGALATNVPGPRQPLTMQGSAVLELLPCIPIAMRLRTAIAILSYGDNLAFGITGDYDSAPDIDVIADGIRAGIAELVAHTAICRLPRQSDADAPTQDAHHGRGTPASR